MGEKMSCVACDFGLPVVKKKQVPVYSSKDLVVPIGYVMLDMNKYDIQEGANVRIVVDEKARMAD